MPTADTAHLWFDSALLPNGWAGRVRLAVSGGRIASIQANVKPAAHDERHEVCLPGLPNVHSHGFQRGMAGLTEKSDASGNTFWSWRELMYRFVDRLTPEDVEALAAYAYVEMLESGFTRVGEFHYLHHAPDGKPYADPAEMSARIAAAAADAGIALTLLPVFYAHGGFGGTPPAPEQRRFTTDPQRFARLLEAARRAVAAAPGGYVGMAFHSLRAITPDELSKVAPLAANGPIHIHAAEQLREVEDCVAWCGQRPVEWLLDHAGVGERWCLVHATHLTDGETHRLAASRAVVGLCPITEANLGDGIFPAEGLLRAGGRIGIGSDSNVLIDPAEELRVLEYGQRLTHRSRNVLAGASGQSTGRRLFDAVRAGGAQALGADSTGLAAGLPADFFSLDTRHASFAGRSGDALLDTWIFAGGASSVDCVWCEGRRVVTGGEHHARSALAERYTRTLKKLLA
jgi:formiminoglutamate deiminase